MLLLYKTFLHLKLCSGDKKSPKKEKKEQRKIWVGSELLVWYTDKYAKKISRPTAAQIPVNEDGNYTWMFCHPYSLLKHVSNYPRGAGKEMRCDDCGDEYIYLKSLNNHVEKTHRWERVYECGVKFRREKELRHHIESAHMIKTEQWKCGECQKEFT